MRTISVALRQNCMGLETCYRPLWLGNTYPLLIMTSVKSSSLCPRVTVRGQSCHVKPRLMCMHGLSASDAGC